MPGPDVAILSTWPVSFCGTSPTERPLGGSETAIVEVARRLVRRGLSCEVWCHLPPGRAGVYDGVVYREGDEARAALGGRSSVGTLIVSRDAPRCALGRHASRTLLWIQDMPMEGLRRQHQEALPHLDRILAVSQVQRDRFVAVHGLPREVFSVARNGVDAARLRGLAVAPRVPGRLVHASTPFRGLAVLLDAFPRIREAAPWAELHIYSGMAGYDQPDTPFEALYAKALTVEGVTRHAPVPQPELARAIGSADLMAYPATFRETSCIAAMMAIALGAPVVASDLGALPETVAECGVIVPGDARRDPTFTARFADAVSALLLDRQRLDALRTRCLARDLDWEPVVDAWWPLLAP